MKNTTELDSNYDDLDQMDTFDLLSNINYEDKKVAAIVESKISEIGKLVDVITNKVIHGGRLFYIGAGTSGRLGILDASECPPTFGVDHGVVVGLIAGGDNAIRRAVEFAEDDQMLGWSDLQSYNINDKDVVIGIAASGATPYVVGALEMCKKSDIVTGCIVCNVNSPLANLADFPVELIVGPEFVTGSTRMKSGTAQKLVLNMISTTLMIKLGRVKGNKMVDMQLANNKLVNRGIKMIMEETGEDFSTASELLDQYDSVRQAIDHYNTKKK